MATSLSSATLKVTIEEKISLNGVKRGSKVKDFCSHINPQLFAAESFSKGEASSAGLWIIAQRSG